MEYPFVYAPGIAQYIISLHIGSMKFGQILALWVLTCPPPNPNPNPNANPKPRSPENWNLGRSWHFGFWLGRTHSPLPRKLKFSQILALWVLTVGVCGD